MNNSQFDFVMRTAMIVCMLFGAFSFIPASLSDVVGSDILEGYTSLAWFWVFGMIGYLVYQPEYSQQNLQEKLIAIGVTTAIGIASFVVTALVIFFG
ncbi:hypothetical protein [uncultured Alteromonas sp.]|uniref:hypothetical protein n=1 Tax=uncultured Alteromonas sp. TaxID=179113 RepID=UPI0030D3B2B2|tara:strand:+ start:28982 stop:29272 length:291 start_codon:yes stop_codon:yes gene_type:complete